MSSTLTLNALDAGPRPSIATGAAVSRPGPAADPAAMPRQLEPKAALAGTAAPTSSSPPAETATGLSNESSASLAVVAAVNPVPPALESAASLPSAPSLQALEARWWADGILFLDQGQEWAATDVATLDAALSSLPASVRSQLGNPALGPLQVHINRIGQTISGNQPYGGPANFYSTNEGRNDLVLFSGQGVATVLHEFGHAYNLRGVPAATYAQVFLDAEMQSFMSATGWTVLTPAAEIARLRDHGLVKAEYRGPVAWTRVSREDPLEDFANSFALYFSDAPALLKLSPERHAWFERNLGR